jgi:hypothetical protein
MNIPGLSVPTNNPAECRHIDRKKADLLRDRAGEETYTGLVAIAVVVRVTYLVPGAPGNTGNREMYMT